jgi:hypothetical protein
MASSTGSFPEKPFTVEAFDPEPAREKRRGELSAIASLTFLCIVVFYLFSATRSDDKHWPQVKEAMQSILPAVTSVLGTVLGFYFGSQKR